MRRLPPRLMGLALLAASGASTLAHRAVYEAARHGPAQAAEFALGLLTFILASAGVLLLVHGAKLFEQNKSRDGPAQASSIARPSRSMEPMDGDGRAYDTMQGASSMQARHASAASRTPATRQFVAGRPRSDDRCETWSASIRR